MDTEDDLIDLATAAALVGVNPSTLRRAAQARRLDARKVGRDWVTTPRAVKAWKKKDEHHKRALEGLQSRPTR